MNWTSFRALAFLAFLSPTVAQAQTAFVDLTPGVVAATQYGKINGSADPNDNVESVFYSFDLNTSYRVSISAKLFDNNFPGNYANPGEIAIQIDNFVPETDGIMPAKRLEFRDFSITGILPAGFNGITVSNRLNSNYRWGIKDVLVTLVEPLGEVPQEPFIPEPPLPVTPSASIINVSNFCDARFSTNDVSFYPELPLTILEYADQIMADTAFLPSRSDRERFLDYIHYVERVTDKSYLRESIGTNDFNLESSFALLEIPGEQSEFGESPFVWCPASCPTGYDQIAIQCNSQVSSTQGLTSINLAEGFSTFNVCGFDLNNTDQDFENLSIATNLTCARDIQTFDYRDVQGTPDWPFKY